MIAQKRDYLANQVVLKMRLRNGRYPAKRRLLAGN